RGTGAPGTAGRRARAPREPELRGSGAPGRGSGPEALEVASGADAGAGGGGGDGAGAGGDGPLEGGGDGAWSDEAAPGGGGRGRRAPLCEPPRGDRDHAVHRAGADRGHRSLAATEGDEPMNDA